MRANASRLVDEMLRQGITTVEIKSGYGLTVADEARSVAIAARADAGGDLPRRARGARRRRSRPTTSPWSPVRCSRPAPRHARWIDVFCERGAFDADQARAILRAGAAAGLLPRVHANQLGEGPGVQLAVELGAASADHCTHLSQADVDALAASDTVATLLPGVEFSTRSPYPGRPAPPRSRRDGRPGHRLQPRARATRPRWRCASPWRSGRCG